jgi:hypothetical protein
VPRQKKFDEDLFYQKLIKNGKRQIALSTESTELRNIAYTSNCLHKHTRDIQISDHDDDDRLAYYPGKVCFVCRRTKANHENKWRDLRYLYLF